VQGFLKEKLPGRVARTSLKSRNTLKGVAETATRGGKEQRKNKIKAKSRVLKMSVTMGKTQMTLGFACNEKKQRLVEGPPNSGGKSVGGKTGGTPWKGMVNKTR